jgi:hypothetical protein
VGASSKISVEFLLLFHTKLLQMYAMRFLIVLSLFFALASGAMAAIDSGGGMADLGSGTNHSSIGAPLATGGSAVGLMEILYPTAPELYSAADTDSDGLPDSWENENFGSLTANAAADSDGDGNSNLMEYFAGTDPGSAASVFRPTSHVADGNLVLTMPTVSGRSYRVWGTPNLQGTWVEHDTITGDGSTVEWLYALSQSPKYFLKIEILIPTN